jgi:hypothetical protein
MKNAARIPELLLKTGLFRDIDLVRIAAVTFTDLVVVLGGSVVDDLYEADLYLTMPGADVDDDAAYEQLAIARGLPAPDTKRVDEVLEKVIAVIYDCDLKQELLPHG